MDKNIRQIKLILNDGTEKVLDKGLVLYEEEEGTLDIDVCNLNKEELDKYINTVCIL